MGALHGILASYKMRTKHDNPSKKEATLKSSNETREIKKKSKSSCRCSDDSDEDEEIANFVRRLKK
jgi:hypothetical protein